MFMSYPCNILKMSRYKIKQSVLKQIGDKQRTLKATICSTSHRNPKRGQLNIDEKQETFMKKKKTYIQKVKRKARSI